MLFSALCPEAASYNTHCQGGYIQPRFCTACDLRYSMQHKHTAPQHHAWTPPPQRVYHHHSPTVAAAAAPCNKLSHPINRCFPSMLPLPVYLCWAGIGRQVNSAGRLLGCWVHTAGPHKRQCMVPCTAGHEALAQLLRVQAHDLQCSTAVAPRSSTTRAAAGITRCAPAAPCGIFLRQPGRITHPWHTFEPT